MGKPTGFLEIDRKAAVKRDVAERKQDYNEVELAYNSEQATQQASRCMDCGTPFCHSTHGCPLGNIIPEFNDAVYEQNWEYAYQILSSTNNFPEFTGRICPAPCENACVLGINKPPVAIEYIEKSIIEKAYENGWVKPNVPKKRTGKKVAVVGGGPAGLATAAQLNKAGHWVTVFERADEVGGLLRYGIPDFKLDKSVVRRRVAVMVEEGIEFRTNTAVGKDIKAEDLLNDFDAVVLAGGSTVPRDVRYDRNGNLLKGGDLKGIYPAMEFLSQQNKRVAGIERVKDHRGVPYENGELLATNKNVFVIGGGDTGSDCVGTSNRHGAKSITQIEVMPEPEIDDKKTGIHEQRSERTPWPMWAYTKRTSTSHEEGCTRLFSIAVKEFIGDENGNLKAIKIADIATIGGKTMEANERELPCELALMAAGFLHPQQDLLEQLEIELDERKNVKAVDYQTSNPKVFAAGDMRRGQSLVVWAISEGRECARKVDEYLMGDSYLEAKAVSMITPEYLGV